MKSFGLPRSYMQFNTGLPEYEAWPERLEMGYIWKRSREAEGGTVGPVSIMVHVIHEPTVDRIVHSVDDLFRFL